MGYKIIYLPRKKVRDGGELRAIAMWMSAGAYTQPVRDVPSSIVIQLEERDGKELHVLRNSQNLCVCGITLAT